MTTKNDHVDHSVLESSSMLNLGKQDEPDKVEILAKATKDVPEELETIETKSMNSVKNTSKNVGKRTRQDNGGNKTKVSNFISHIYFIRPEVYASNFKGKNGVILIYINVIFFGPCSFL